MFMVGTSLSMTTQTKLKPGKPGQNSTFNYIKPARSTSTR